MAFVIKPTPFAPVSKFGGQSRRRSEDRGRMSVAPLHRAAERLQGKLADVGLGMRSVGESRRRRQGRVSDPFGRRCPFAHDLPHLRTRDVMWDLAIKVVASISPPAHVGFDRCRI